MFAARITCTTNRSASCRSEPSAFLPPPALPRVSFPFNVIIPLRDAIMSFLSAVSRTHGGSGECGAVPGRLGGRTGPGRLRRRPDLLWRQHGVLQPVARRRNPTGHRRSALPGRRSQRARHATWWAVRRPPVRRRPQFPDRAPGAGTAREERCHPLHHRVDREWDPTDGAGTGPAGTARATAPAAAGVAGVQPAGRSRVTVDLRHRAVRTGLLDQLAAVEHRTEPGAL